MNQLPLVGGSNHGHWTSVSEQSLRNGRIFVLVKEGCGRIEKYELKRVVLEGFVVSVWVREGADEAYVVSYLGKWLKFMKGA